MEIMEEKRNLNPQLNLQWHQHHDTLVSLLKLLWEKQELVDVTLVAAGGKSIQVHRIVLCACSKYFQDVLTMKSSSDKQAIIFLKDISYEDLQGLVDYMYKGEVRVNQDQLNSFLYSAKSLGIRGLMDAENNMTNTSTSIKDERRKNKRRRSISSVSSCGTGTEPMVIHPPDGTSSNNAVPPPLPSTTQPQLINHNNKMMHHHHHPGVKTEPLMSNTSHHYHHQDMNHHFHHPPDFMDTLTQSNNSHNQSISAQEIEDDDLEMLQYAVRPGPSNGNNADGLSNMHQDSSGGFSCGRCGRIYQWRSTLQRHAKYECNVEPGFICPICQAPFHHKNVLQRHLNTRHHKS